MNILENLESKEIVSSSFKPPVLFRKGEVLFVTKEDERISIKVTGKNIDELFDLKNHIDEISKINAFEEGTYRTVFKPSRGFEDMIPLFVVIPLMLIHAGLGVGISLTGTVGLIIGVFIIMSAVLIVTIVCRSILNSIEGTCPICDKKIKTSRKVKELYCSKCKIKINVKDDYLEV